MVDFGAHGQDRTADLSLTKGVLYHWATWAFNQTYFTGAGDEVRTRDILLGRQVLYQLSYSRKSNTLHTAALQLVERVGFEPT